MYLIKSLLEILFNLKFKSKTKRTLDWLKYQSNKQKKDQSKSFVVHWSLQEKVSWLIVTQHKTSMAAKQNLVNDSIVDFLLVYSLKIR